MSQDCWVTPISCLLGFSVWSFNQSEFRLCNVECIWINFLTNFGLPTPVRPLRKSENYSIWTATFQPNNAWDTIKFYRILREVSCGLRSSWPAIIRICEKDSVIEIFYHLFGLNHLVRHFYLSAFLQRNVIPICETFQHTSTDFAHRVLYHPNVRNPPSLSKIQKLIRKSALSWCHIPLSQNWTPCLAMRPAVVGNLNSLDNKLEYWS